MKQLFLGIGPLVTLHYIITRALQCVCWHCNICYVIIGDLRYSKFNLLVTQTWHLYGFIM